MIFEALSDSDKRKELILIDGGYCRFRRRKDNHITILEILSQRPGAGSEMLARLRAIPGALSIFARCPADLPSNEWYKRRGFALERVSTTKSGKRRINEWRLTLRS